jgi:tRNA threonylcarbamoyladenosine biosynthesis protein TsaE
MRIVSTSPRTTGSLAKMLAQELLTRPPRLRHATVITLEGPLGAGKTTFAQAFARAFGVTRNLPSPTFVFMRRYPLRKRRYRNLFHVDAYRIRNASPRTLAPLGLTDVLKDPQNVFLIEWGRHLRRALPGNIVSVTFRHGTREGERVITSGK